MTGRCAYLIQGRNSITVSQNSAAMHRTRKAFAVLLLLSLVTLASCTAQLRSSSKPAPFKTGVQIFVLKTCKATGGAAAMAGPIPVYPRARPSLAFTLPPGGHQRILESDDSWQTIADWYRHAMPAGAERKPKPDCDKPLPKGIPPPEIAMFSVGALGKDYRAVMISGLPSDGHGWPEKRVPRTLIMIQDR